MLPGVELARRRRLHHHKIPARPPPDPPATRHPAITHQPTGDECAVAAARRRLEGRLRSFSGSPQISPQTPISSRSSDMMSRRRVVERKESRRSDVCAVCLDEVVAAAQPQQQAVTRLPCSHRYHSDCLRPWLDVQAHCPCCRTIVVPSLHILS